MEDVTYSMLRQLFKNISKHILQCKTNDRDAFSSSRTECAKKDMDIHSLTKASTLYYSLSGKASLNTHELSTTTLIGNKKNYFDKFYIRSDDTFLNFLQFFSIFSATFYINKLQIFLN